MDQILKVMSKFVSLLLKEGYTVTGDSNCNEGYVVTDVDDLSYIVEDDGQREQWYGSVKVTKDGTDVSFDVLTPILVKVLKKSPTHPFNHSTQSPMTSVNNWEVSRKHVLVVHSTNGVDFFEDYIKVSVKK